ncbi:MAG: hypothetical protein GXO19_00300 [Epsilonproteobacteria bacterium]|nr:hypothetical protein [Campylobacterota bacterium]NPA56152.1 hypothetical protein [Campylobacterota bacterium]
MPLPFIIAGGAVAAAIYGIGKGVDAIEKNEEAERICKRAKEHFEEKQSELEMERRYLNRKLEEFGRYKLDIFTSDFKEFIELVRKCKEAKSSLIHREWEIEGRRKGEYSSFISELERDVELSLEIEEGLVSGITTGALTAFGVYGSVGLFASASTGTAIASLSGAAATNATLAWLGGGSLATGGFGMAGGMAVLGGLVAGPAILITGLLMDSQAEKNLTAAYELEAEVEEKIEMMEEAITEMELIEEGVDELRYAIDEIRENFSHLLEKVTTHSLSPCRNPQMGQLLALAKGLKEALSISIIDEDGQRNLFIKEEIERITL